VLMMFLLVLVGAGSILPAALGSVHTALPRYGVVSVPLWLTVLVGAGAFDTWQRMDDARTFVIVDWLLGFHDIGFVPDPAKVSLWDAARFADQPFSLGLFTTAATFMFIGVLTMWARYMGSASILTYPLIGWGMGLAAAVVVSMTMGSAIAAPYVTVGLGVGVVFGVRRSRCWPLVMTWYQGWHADQTHKFLAVGDVRRPRHD